MSVQQKQANDVDGGRAWVVLIAVYLAVAFICTIVYMNGLYLAVLVEYYHEDLTKTSLVGALNSSLLCLLAPVVSVFMDTYSCRICMVIGGLLLSFSYFISFFVRSVNVFIVTIGIIGGIGNSFAIIPTSVLLAYYFNRWRNIFISFKEVLVGFGMFVASPVLLWFIDMFGVNGSFLIVSGLALQITICGLLCAPNSEEKKIRRTKSGVETRRQDAHTNFFLRKVKSSTLLSLSLCKDVSIICFMFSTLTWNLILSAICLHLPRYMLTKGFNKVAVVSVMTIFGLCNTLGRFCAATTVGKGGLDSYILHTGTLGVLSLAAILFPLYASWSSAGFLFSALCGFYSGGPNALMVTLTISLAGVEKLTSAYGLTFFFCGVGVLAGPPLLGILYTATESYDYSFMAIGFVGLLGILFSLVAFSGKDSQDDAKKLEIDVPANNDTALTDMLKEDKMNGAPKIDRKDKQDKLKLEIDVSMNDDTALTDLLKEDKMNDVLKVEREDKQNEIKLEIGVLVNDGAVLTSLLVEHKTNGAMEIVIEREDNSTN